MRNPTTDNLMEAYGHLIQAKLLVDAVLKIDPDTHELCDTESLMADAITQLVGELTNRQETERGAA